MDTDPNHPINRTSITIAVLGKGVVGKTSLIYRFINNKLPDEHDPTIEDNYKVMEMIDDKPIEIQILDTAGEEDYQNWIDQWIESADGFWLVYAINEKETLDALNEKIKRINLHKEKKYPIILVGNKCDLEESRQVSKEDGIKFGEKINAKLYETSAKTDQNNNCKEPFLHCAKKIVKERNSMTEKDKIEVEKDGKESGSCSVI